MDSKNKKKTLVILFLGFILGILFWGGFHTVVEETNSLEFCISCHEMENTVYQEYLDSMHYKNAAGVRALCADCHVPHEWLPKMIRKVRATNELFHKVMGTIDTPEKFEAKREEMALHVWADMKKTDSRECRNCHSYEAMDFHMQERKSAREMKKVIDEKTGETCIDCHKGVAHDLPKGYKEDSKI